MAAIKPKAGEALILDDKGRVVERVPFKMKRREGPPRFWRGKPVGKRPKRKE